jgi:hypothetical protein
MEETFADAVIEISAKILRLHMENPDALFFSIKEYLLEYFEEYALN